MAHPSLTTLERPRNLTSVDLTAPTTVPFSCQSQATSNVGALTKLIVGIATDTAVQGTVRYSRMGVRGAGGSHDDLPGSVTHGLDDAEWRGGKC
jgi:hypothetical protein